MRDEIVTETLYQKAVLGHRAEFALEELDEFIKQAQGRLFSDMLNSKDPAEAWTAACKYRAYQEFVEGARASVSVGKNANALLTLNKEE
jgi:hypothetical protein